MSLVKDLWKRLRKNLLVRDEKYAFWQHPKASEVAYTSHGSAEMPQVTNRSEDPYDTNRFKKDPAYILDKDTIDVHTVYGDLRIQKSEFRGNAKGQNIPAVFNYDPSGLRSTPTTNWAAFDAAMAKVEPKHFPRTLATDEEMAVLVAECQAKGRPIPCGVRYRYERVTDNYNKVLW